MKNLLLRKTALLFLVFALFPLTLSDCTKADPAIKPVLSTSSVINIAATTATAGGFVTSDGGAEVTSYGVCWGTNANPSISDSKTSDGAGIGQFVSSLTGLTAGTAYHIRAYAINSVGTSYGTDITFTTLGQSPTGLAQPASNISLISATLNGIINPNNLSTTVTFEYGLNTTYGQTITATQSPVTGNNLAIVSADISGLTQGTVYHFRVKTVNSIGTINGSDLSFITLGQAPAGVTQPATNVLTTGATLNGAINPNSVSTTVTFEYGTTTSYGLTATAAQSPITGGSIVNVSKDIASLNSGTTYHFRVKTVNSLGTIYGGDMLFVTLGQTPESATIPATNITATAATLNGIVNANYLSTSITFEYGLTTSYGQTATASQSPVTGNSIINVSASISGLVGGTNYHYRLKGTNSMGTTYGNDISFTTNSGGTTTSSLIAYSSNESGNSDIWKMNIDGTNKIQLTTNSAADNAPRWSPDGSRIVFISNRNGYYQMWTMNSDGTNQTLLYTDPGYNHEGPSWSKDGSLIYYSRGLTGSGTCTPCPTYEIWRINADGTNPVRITNDNFRDHSPYLSPDGQKIVFAKAKSAGDCCNATDVCIMNSDGTNMQRIAVASGTYSWPYGGWSPDGTKILYIYPAGLPYGLYTMNPDGTGKTLLDSNGIACGYSKDGSKILYLNFSGSGGCDIWIMNSDGTNKKAIATTSFTEDNADLY